MHVLRYHRSTYSYSIAALALLTLWLSFSSVEHQLESLCDEHHEHAHHNCELFSSIHTAILPSALLVPLEEFSEEVIVSNKLPPYFSDVFGYSARSPPELS
ncbi:DUF2607 family protein [Vibrio mexicanus]|uniref:DUF2607 family protein n=1 Tax=Vibrio mexicanus TaxID=1004326 RepID=UPI00063C3C3D|nr:DUF2607 family protein [Vibrio mexicanus]